MVKRLPGYYVTKNSLVIKVKNSWKNIKIKFKHLIGVFARLVLPGIKVGDTVMDMLFVIHEGASSIFSWNCSCNTNGCDHCQP
jgi:hypothetical protein